MRERLKFGRLGKVARAAFLADAIMAQHAELLTRVPEEKQVEAMTAACFHQLYRQEFPTAVKTGDWTPLREMLAPIGELRHWIRTNTVADLKDDAVQQEIPELQALLQEHEKTGTTITRLSEGNYKVPTGILSSDQWRDAAKAKCEHRFEGVVVHGGPLGIRKACATRTCKTHWPELQKAPATSARAGSPSTGKWEKQEAERRSRENAFARLRKQAWPGVVKAVTAHAKVNARLVSDVLSTYAVREVTNKTGIRFSDETATAVLALHGILRKAHTHQTFASAVKAYGFDLKRFERETKKAKAAAGKAPRTGSASKARNVKKGKK